MLSQPRASFRSASLLSQKLTVPPPPHSSLAQPSSINTEKLLLSLHWIDNKMSQWQLLYGIFSILMHHDVDHDVQGLCSSLSRYYYYCHARARFNRIWELRNTHLSHQCDHRTAMRSIGQPWEWRLHYIILLYHGTIYLVDKQEDSLRGVQNLIHALAWKEAANPDDIFWTPRKRFVCKEMLLSCHFCQCYDRHWGV